MRAKFLESHTLLFFYYHEQVWQIQVPRTLLYIQKNCSVGRKEKMWILWAKADTQVTENPEDDWGLTWY